jgi:hypothetical protein
MLITNLTTNMVVVLSNMMLHTNTPVFSNYCLEASVANAKVIVQCWHLDQNAIDTNRVNHFICVANTYNPFVDVVFNRQYGFNFGTVEQGFAPRLASLKDESEPLAISGKTARNVSLRFEDLFNCLNGPGEFGPDLGDLAVRLERWEKMPSILTLDNAEAIAESGIRCLGISMGDMKFASPKRKEQRSELGYGAEHLLPYYTFVWESAKGSCQVDVSGLTETIVAFYFEGNCPNLNFSTNWTASLGITTNTTFVIPTRYTIKREPLPPYRLFPYSVPMPKNVDPRYMLTNAEAMPAK